MVKRLVLVSVSLLVLGACDGGSTSDPQAEATGPQPLPAATAEPRISESPDENGRYRIEPVSPPAEVGVPYDFTLFTRCGLDTFVDFNGSLWDTVDEAGSKKKGPPAGFESPEDRGVMTLVNQELAEFESSSGKLVRFIRHPGAKKVKSCEGLTG